MFFNLCESTTNQFDQKSYLRTNIFPKRFCLVGLREQLSFVSDPIYRVFLYNWYFWFAKISLRNAQNWVKKSRKLNSLKGHFIYWLKKMASVRIDGSNSPFTEEEKIWINLRYGKLRNELQVYQAFRLQLLLNLLLMKSLKWVWKSFLFPCSSLQKSESVSATWEIAPETVYL